MPLAKTGTSLKIIGRNEDIVDKLDSNKVYQIVYSRHEGIYKVQEVENFERPKKIYGDIEIIKRLVIESSKENTINRSYVFNGEKGNGKTLAIKEIAVSLNKPILILDQNYFSDDDFINFITNSVFQDTVLMIDEYEKIIDVDVTPNFLKFLDGIYNTNFIVLLSANSVHLNKYINNRTSRVLYKFDYNNCSYELIKEILDDQLKDKSKYEIVLNTLLERSPVNVDQVLSFINQVNNIDVDTSVIARYINISDKSLEKYATIHLKLSQDEDFRNMFDINVYVSPKKQIINKNIIVEDINLSYRDYKMLLEYVNFEKSKFNKENFELTYQAYREIITNLHTITRLEVTSFNIQDDIKTANIDFKIMFSDKSDNDNFLFFENVPCLIH